MRGAPTSFWGKLDQDGLGTVLAWHPLADHCADVAAVAEALLELPVWRTRLARLSGQTDLDPVIRARLCALCALHDLGKLSIPFQAKGRTDLGSVTGGHVEAGLGALADARIYELLAPLGCFGVGAEGLLCTALAHHGRPFSADAADHQSSRWRSRGGLDPVQGAEDLVGACRRWFPAAFGPGPELPEGAAFEHAFAGLVMLADWIASDVEFFPFTEPSDGDRMGFARLRAGKIVGRLALDVPVASRLDPAGRDSFSRVSEYAPSAAQRAIGSLPMAARGSIAVLESETGSGKTEAALAHFVRLFELGAIDGLYFALPTRTAATQIWERVKWAAVRAFQELAPPVVLAVPGYLRVDELEGRRLPGFQVLWTDSNAERFRFRGWAAEGPKRYLAGAIVVGTIDQVLLSSVRVSHAHLRATALLRHLLVVDEVHASDGYMNRILEDVLTRHTQAGGHALLLSATLGAEARAAFLRASQAPAAREISFEEAVSAPYPLVTNFGSDSGLQAIGVVHDGRRREITLSVSPIMEDAAQVAARAAEAAVAGAKVLVLRNTVADCVETQRAVELALASRPELLFACGGVPAPHHARYSREDRRALDSAIEERLGKERPPGGCVVVATQTVQQSLDLDADLLLTDLCPIDVLLQRVGRLHRHERLRPVGFEQTRATVLVPVSRDLSALVGTTGRPRSHHGLGSVYEDLRVLDATWREIERGQPWRIPEMSRELVERCLHSSRLDGVVRELGPRFALHASWLTGERLGKARIAELNLIDRTKPYSRTTFGSELDERIKTRLGEEDRRVVVDPPQVSPFGRRIDEFVLPERWVRGVETATEPSGLRREGMVIRFEFGPKTFVYDRLGLRPEPLPAAPTALPTGGAR